MFKKLYENSILPSAQTKYSAGYDVCAFESVVVRPGEVSVVSLGIALNLSASEILQMQNVYLDLRIRSGLSTKGLQLANGAGVVDIDYRDEIGMICYNYSQKEIFIASGQRVGQILVSKQYGHELLGNRFRKEDKRLGGYGSTGES